MRYTKDILAVRVVVCYRDIRLGRNALWKQNYLYCHLIYIGRCLQCGEDKVRCNSVTGYEERRPAHRDGAAAALLYVI